MGQIGDDHPAPRGLLIDMALLFGEGFFVPANERNAFWYRAAGEWMRNA
jgi:hypothetical protein